jgi:predicted dithiol-disulfide oxidoreductase (DUF899 family)
MSLPKIASQEEWLAAREELLAKEKQLVRDRDALSTARRELPMVEITKDYAFTGPDGPVSLLDMFGEHRQLIVGHFMFDPEWEDGCPSCSAGAEELSQGLLDHLAVRDTAFAYISLAPIDRILAYQAKRGWDHPWYSSNGTDFNHDFHVTVDRSRGPAIYNFREWGDELLEGEYPGTSCFLRVDDRVFRTYSMYARGAETLGGSYYWLDLTALGRQEEWEKPEGRTDSARAAQPDFAS